MYFYPKYRTGSGFSKVLHLVVIVVLHLQIAAGQISYGGYPPGLLEHTPYNLLKSTKSFPVGQFSPGETDSLEMEYANSPLFAFPKPLLSQPEERGEWFDLGSHLLWRLVLDVEDSRGIIIGYDQFQLAEDAFLFAYSADSGDVHGGYTRSNNSKSGRFMTGIIRGHKVVIEYLVSRNHSKKLDFRIDKIYRLMHPVRIESGAALVDTGFQASFPCHVNANCPEGDGLDLQKKGTIRVMMVLEEGVGWCSGALLNNTLEDSKPYVLTAFHCQHGYTPIYDLWRFDFQFDSPGCADPEAAPSKKSLLGCQQRAARLETDLLLLELNDPIPQSYGVYYCGWDKTGVYGNEPYRVIHHPAGDIKKVSVENNSLFVFNGTVSWDNDTSTPPQSHLRCDLDIGGHQAGSSGGPMFDPTGLLIGHLHGGTVNEDCNQTRTYIGRFSESWTGNSPADQLSDWLDPAGLNPDQLQGRSPSGSSLISLSGSIETPTGTPVPNVIVRVSGPGSSSSVMSGGDGGFQLNGLDASNEIQLTFEFTTEANKGISALDLVLIRNHILGLNVFQEEYQLLAADANRSNSITAADLVQIQNVLLEWWDSFPNNESWGFLPNTRSIDISDNGTHISIVAYKIGDANSSVRP